jgi:hypothetical protein
MENLNISTKNLKRKYDIIFEISNKKQKIKNTRNIIPKPKQITIHPEEALQINFNKKFGCDITISIKYNT